MTSKSRTGIQNQHGPGVLPNGNGTWTGKPQAGAFHYHQDADDYISSFDQMHNGTRAFLLLIHKHAVMLVLEGVNRNVRAMSKEDAQPSIDYWKAAVFLNTNPRQILYFIMTLEFQYIWTK